MEDDLKFLGWKTTSNCFFLSVLRSVRQYLLMVKSKKKLKSVLKNEVLEEDLSIFRLEDDR